MIQSPHRVIDNSGLYYYYQNCYITIPASTAAIVIVFSLWHTHTHTHTHTHNEIQCQGYIIVLCATKIINIKLAIYNWNGLELNHGSYERAAGIARDAANERLIIRIITINR